MVILDGDNRSSSRSRSMTLTVNEGDVGTSSNSKIFANIMISFIGAGILGLPFAFREVCIYIHCAVDIYIGSASYFVTVCIYSERL